MDRKHWQSCFAWFTNAAIFNLLSMTYGRELYISNNNGTDTLRCGTSINNPCKTLDFIQNKTSSFDQSITIHFHATGVEYILNSITFQQPNIRITRYPKDSSFSPVLSGKPDGRHLNLTISHNGKFHIASVTLRSIQIYVLESSTDSLEGTTIGNGFKIQFINSHIESVIFNIGSTVENISMELKNITISKSQINFESKQDFIPAKKTEIEVSVENARISHVPGDFIKFHLHTNTYIRKISLVNILNKGGNFGENLISILTTNTSTRIEEIYIHDCQALVKNAVSIIGGTVVLKNIKISHSQAYQGLRISEIGKGSEINNVLFQNSMFQSKGVSIGYSSLLVKHLKFVQSQFAEDGFFVTSSIDVKVIDVMMLKNMVWYNSMISSVDSVLNIKNLTLSNSKMPRAIRVQKNSIFQILDTIIQNNTISEGLYVSESTSRMVSTKFIDNKVYALLYCIKSNITLTTIDISSDVAPVFKVIYYSTKSVNGLTISMLDIKIKFNRGLLKHPIFDLDLATSKATLSDIIIDLVSWKSDMQVSEITSNIVQGVRHSLSNMTIKCPANYLINEVNDISLESRTMEVSCQKCDRGLYSLEQDIKSFWFNLTLLQYHQSFKFNSKSLLESECRRCPVGGVCIDGEIKSKANFYGYITKKNQVRFRPCPSKYCCLQGQCQSISSCQRLRTGMLCGSCKKNHFESYFSTDCMPIASCKSSINFWVPFIILAFLFTLGLMYSDQFKIIFRKLVHYLSSIVSRCSKSSDTDSIDGDSESDEALINLTDLQTGENYQKKNEIITGAKESEEQPKATTSGIFNILISFYQIKQLISVKFNETETESKISTYFSKLFNLDLIIVEIKAVCPSHYLNAITKGLIKNYLMPVIMILFVVGILGVYTIVRMVYNKFYGFAQQKLNYDIGENEEDEDDDEKEINKLTFPSRLALCYIKILMFSYKNIAAYSIVLFHCVKIEDKMVLFILGDEVCYQWWQKLDMFFFVSWVLLFPIALSGSYRMFMEDKISMFEFLLCITFVPSVVYFHFQRRNTISTRLLSESSQKSNVANILAPMFEESYRHIERTCSGKTFIFWETWRLYQRLILALVVTLESNPVIRICYISPVILAFVFIYITVHPYKEELIVLHGMEVVMLLGFCFQVVSNMFRAFLYVFDIPNNNPIPVSIDILRALDYLISPIFVLIYFYVLKPICKRIFKFRSCLIC